MHCIDTFKDKYYFRISKKYIYGRTKYNINKISGLCTMKQLNKYQELEFDLFRLDEEPRYEYSGQVTILFYMTK